MKTRIYKAILTALLMLSAMAGTAAAELPATFDWRDVDGVNYVTPVKHQLTCGACWAFATLACVESAYKIYVDPTTDLDLSEQYFVSDCFPEGDCYGGWPGEMLIHIKHVGTPSEECFPYIAANCGCSPCTGWETEACKIEGFLKVDRTTAAYKQALYEHGPIVSQRSDDHSVCVVGWNDTTGNWTYKNSYGTGSYNEGFPEIPYGDIETLGDAYVVTGILKEWTSPVSATASSTWYYTGPPSAAIDGKYEDINDVWSSDFEVPCWIQFDLGEEMSIDAAYLSLGSPKYNPTTFNLSVSADNISWTPVAENVISPLSETMFELPIDTTTARYIRLDVISASNMGVCWEFGVIETPICGDVNGDGNVNTLDVTRLFDYVTYGTPPVGASVADVTGDGNVNVLDVTRLFDYVTYGSPPLNCQC